MISTSGILSTGLKKCRPMNFSGRATAWASPVIGRVEVLDATTASARACFSASAVTLPFSARSSKTASMIRSQPSKSASLTLGTIRARKASRFGGQVPARNLLVQQPGRISLALLRRFQRDVLEHHLDAGRRRYVGDARAHHPGAEHADLFVARTGYPCGRDLPALISLSWNQKVPIMFFATWPVVSSVK